MITACKTIKHDVDFCVIGGGLAGMLAAISAARRGVRVALMQDRPVLGGNCSSEIRMWALGCHGENNRESGILEEIMLENLRRNPQRNFSIWDSILYEKVRFEPNIELILNCSCQCAEMDGNRIKTVRGWQLTTYLYHEISADYFADCSGDSVLAPLTGAEYRVGREASSEYGETIEPEIADSKTMGMSCLMQARETSHRVEYIPPDWAYTYDNDEQINRAHEFCQSRTQNFWWIELGGDGDSIRDTEELRDELLKITFGIWDHIKNRGEHGAENWELEWVGFLPGKRESRRYIGDHVMCQNEVAEGGRYEDIVAYGGWTMDDHDPAGFYAKTPNIFHPAPSPFGIPYRSMYSKNISNLFFAGRNISATHAAISSTRVMATCAIIGQAMGTAASIAVKNRLSPRGVYDEKLAELQDALQFDDCYIPFRRRKMPDLTSKASVPCEALRNGLDRPIDGHDNGYYAIIDEPITYTLPTNEYVHSARIIFDSDFERATCDGDNIMRRYPMLSNKYKDMLGFGFPKTLVKAFRLEIFNKNGNWETIAKICDNRKRFITLPIETEASAVRLVPEATYGAERAHIFSFDIS